MTLFDDWPTWFWKVLVRPFPSTFLEIDAGAKGRFQSAIVWLVIADVISLVLRFILERQAEPWVLMLSVIVIPIAVLIWVYIIHLAYKRIYGRQKDHNEGLLCAFVCILFVFSVIGVVISSLPLNFEIVNSVALVYQGILFFIATRSILKLKWGEAIVVFGLGFVGMLLSIVLVPVFLLSMLQTNSQLFRP